MSRSAIQAVAGLVLALAAPLALAADGGMLLERYQSGTHYAELKVPVAPIHETGGIEVVEVFSYECPHCKELEPTIAGWLTTKPADVDFVRMPAVFNKRYELMARTFYGLEAMAALDANHSAVFHARHVQFVDLSNEEKVADMLAARGVDRGTLLKAMSSFGVRSAVQQSVARSRAYRISSVPTLIIAGRYRVDGVMAGTNAAMFAVADFLVAKERLRRQSAVASR